VYWGGMVPMIGGLLSIGLLWCAVRTQAQARAIQALLAVMLGASAALLFYARVGIDMLDQVYIGLFYYAVPALMVALACLYLFHEARWRHKHKLALVIALACLILCARLVNRPPSYTNIYHAPQVGALYESLKRVPRQGRLVLDLTNDEHWGHVWSNIAGLQVYAKRRGDDFFCLNRNWHILFTTQGQCTAAEKAAGQRLVVRKSGSVPPGSPAPVAEGMELSFIPLPTPRLIGAGWVTVAAHRAMFADYLREEGWSTVEGEFVWAERRKGATLELPLKPGFSGTITLDVAAFLPRADATQRAVALLDGQPVASIAFSASDNRKQVAIPVARTANAGVRLTLRVDKVYSPRDTGSADTRKLGVSLYGIKIEEK